MASRGKLWKLRKAVYGLSDAGTAWYECISNRLISLGWNKLVQDPCLFRRGNQIAALYVDDLLVAAATAKDAMKSIEELGYKLGRGRLLQTGDDFAGVQIAIKGLSFKTATSIELSQETYARSEVRDPSWTRKANSPLPITTLPRDREKENKLDSTGHQSYRSVVGKLMWLAVTTRPDLAYAASYLARSLASPSDRDFQLADRCSAYTKGTAELRLVYPKLDWEHTTITVISDASFAAPRDDFRSQSGHLIFLHDTKNANLVQWKSAAQTQKSAGSSMAAECFAAKPSWIAGLYLRDLIKSLTGRFLPLNLVTDNDDLYKIVKLRKRQIPRDRSLTIAVYQMRESADLDQVNILFTPGKVNSADGLTKPLGDLTPLLEIMNGRASNLGADVDPLAPKK